MSTVTLTFHSILPCIFVRILCCSDDFETYNFYENKVYSFYNENSCVGLYSALRDMSSDLLAM